MYPLAESALRFPPLHNRSQITKWEGGYVCSEKCLTIRHPLGFKFFLVRYI